MKGTISRKLGRERNCFARNRSERGKGDDVRMWPRKGEPNQPNDGCDENAKPYPLFENRKREVETAAAVWERGSALSDAAQPLTRLAA
jgi:hypothetical protein